MGWISGNRYLTLTEMENNALLIYKNLNSRGWSLNAISGMLGNLQRESTLNPAIWQGLTVGSGGGGGYGLAQWTPWTNYTDWADANGYDWADGDAQLKWIDEVTVSFGQWIPTTSCPMTFDEYKKSNESTDYLTLVFLKNFERAGVEVLEERQSNSKYWFDYISEHADVVSYTPRLTDDGMTNNPYYYDWNVFYQAGYGLPNCTCYAWGRRYEITNERPDELSTGDGGDWYTHAVSIGDDVGKTPRLGAVLCMSYEPSGHVAIVEQINDDGSIVISQSAYNGTFFWIETVYPSNNYLPQWALNRNATFQGFIYLDKIYSPTTPPSTGSKNKRLSKLLLYAIGSD